MVTTRMSASFFALILVVLIQGNSEAVPVRDYDGIPSGTLHPISGAVPISVPRRRSDSINKILKAIRARVDKSHVSALDSSVRSDILQDALAPSECLDKYGIRDGILKHTIRGTRDVIGALIKDFQGLGQGILKDLPLVPHVINGIAEAVTYVLCGAEDAASDVISGVDDVPNILTKVLVDLLEFQGSAPLTNVPAGVPVKKVSSSGPALASAGPNWKQFFDSPYSQPTCIKAVVNITELVGRVVSKIASDLVVNIEEGVEDLAAEVGSGVSEVVKDVVEVVSGVETDVTNVVNAVGTAVQRVGGGVETDVTNVVNAVGTAVQRVGGGVGSGVGSIVNGIKGALGDVINAL